MTIKNPNCTVNHAVTSFLKNEDLRLWTDPNTGVRWEVGTNWNSWELEVVVCATCPACGCPVSRSIAGFERMFDPAYPNWIGKYRFHAGCEICSRHPSVTLEIPKLVAEHIHDRNVRIRAAYRPPKW